MITIRGVTYVTAGEAADHLHVAGVTAATIRDWVRRGLLAPAMPPQRGRPSLYDLDAVLTVERDTRLSGRGRRRAAS